MHETPPHQSDDHLQAELPDQASTPNQIDLTGAVRQRELLGAAIDEAIVEGQRHGRIPDWGARVLSRALANECPNPRTGALHRFAVTGTVELAALSASLVELSTYGIVDAAQHERMFWLAIYLAGENRATAVPASVASARERPDVPTHTGPLIAIRGITEHSNAFRAFLRLPDVDQQQAGLLQSFRDCYIGSYESLSAVMTDLASDEVSPEDVAQLAAEGISREELIRATWDIQEVGGRFYVFSK